MTHRRTVEQVFREEYGQVVATLIRILGDFDLAEEAVSEAFTAAVEKWADGVPDNPGAWLTTAARNKAFDRIRREKNYSEKLRALEAIGGPEASEDGYMQAINDDQLRLIFTCCHPALSNEVQVALTLKTLGGLTTAEIARAFLTSESAMAQRLVRAKKKIKAAAIPYVVPEEHDLPDRLSSVLAVLYLIFNEGYSATSSREVVRQGLCAEAIRLCWVLHRLMPDEAEVKGLLALMLLQDSRREARVGANGDLVLLGDQDRNTWDHDEIERGMEHLTAALRRGGPGPYTLQAALAAEHAMAPDPESTDWDRIVALYDALRAIDPSPIVALNRSVAVAMSGDVDRAILDLQALSGDLDSYHLYHSALGDLLSRAGRQQESFASFEKALSLASNPAERSFLEARLNAFPREHL